MPPAGLGIPCLGPLPFHGAWIRSSIGMPRRLASLRALATTTASMSGRNCKLIVVKPERRGGYMRSPVMTPRKNSREHSRSGSQAHCGSPSSHAHGESDGLVDPACYDLEAYGYLTMAVLGLAGKSFNAVPTGQAARLRVRELVEPGTETAATGNSHGRCVLIGSDPN
jgi:hypothetical protein